MQTIDAKALLDALTRAIAFQRKQPQCGTDALIALTEVRDAVRYAINPKPPTRQGGKKR